MDIEVLKATKLAFESTTRRFLILHGIVVSILETSLKVLRCDSKSTLKKYLLDISLFKDNIYRALESSDCR